MMDDDGSKEFRISLQILAILLVILVWSMILHKAFTDLWALAGKFSGDEFWSALAKYLIRNLAGG